MERQPEKYVQYEPVNKWGTVNAAEGVNYVEVVRSEICFEFGKTKYPDSSLFILMEDEQLNFKDFIKSEDFEFEIIGNIYENPELLEDKE
ncbi:TPA: YopX family protein [Streptococcus pneumoniae]